ncbi:1-acyl-sn-glycerol-3-phosphate acyltransferase [Frankia sp. CcI49]|uniref:lysophospholipid acyltransferase family protein n=1 Tax=Frankia sp. CcI49 TaxID=1745382 RepID=UPI000978C415|nr:lysophospholipid acyltransferase family protein [Frankia sp. CcI49]ONH61269.1 1-acyl-sn-glycerol-3-phosphate acyltransferase [Frankia sp. CcI49]
MLYWVVKAILTPVLRLFWRPWVEGLDQVPTRGPAILASNHLSFLDSFFLPLVVPRRITFLAKSDYFTGVGFKGWSKRKFFKGVGQVPIDRSGGRASEGALRTGVRVLGSGELLGIYPEGTRSPDGRLYRGKIGVARMALEAGVPVIPVAMIGTFEVQPPGQFMPRIRRVGIRIGRPLDFSRYAGMADDRFVLRSMTDEIMYELMSLSGQEYVDMYAQRRKEELAAAREAQAREAGRGQAEPSAVVEPSAAAEPPVVVESPVVAEPSVVAAPPVVGEGPATRAGKDPERAPVSGS